MPKCVIKVVASIAFLLFTQPLPTKLPHFLSFPFSQLVHLPITRVLLKTVYQTWAPLKFTFPSGNSFYKPTCSLSGECSNWGCLDWAVPSTLLLQFVETPVFTTGLSPLSLSLSLSSGYNSALHLGYSSNPTNSLPSHRPRLILTLFISLSPSFSPLFPFPYSLNSLSPGC